MKGGKERRRWDKNGRQMPRVTLVHRQKEKEAVVIVDACHVALVIMGSSE